MRTRREGGPMARSRRPLAVILRPGAGSPGWISARVVWDYRTSRPRGDGLIPGMGSGVPSIRGPVRRVGGQERRIDYRRSTIGDEIPPRYGAPPGCVRPNETPRGRHPDPAGPVVLDDMVGNGTEALRLSDRGIHRCGTRRRGRRSPICGRYPYLTTTVYSYLTVNAPEKYPRRRKGPRHFGLIAVFGYLVCREIQLPSKPGAFVEQAPETRSCAVHRHVTL